MRLYNRLKSDSGQAWQLKRVSRLYITLTSQAEHTVDHSHGISILLNASLESHNVLYAIDVKIVPEKIT